jgi:hypothetical protein
MRGSRLRSASDLSILRLGEQPLKSFKTNTWVTSRNRGKRVGLSEQLGVFSYRLAWNRTVDNNIPQDQIGLFIGDPVEVISCLEMINRVHAEPNSPCFKGLSMRMCESMVELHDASSSIFIHIGDKRKPLDDGAARMFCDPQCFPQELQAVGTK